MEEQELTRGERDVLAERAKQRKRWGDKHDDREHRDGEFARACAFLAHPGPLRGEPEWARDLWTKLGRQHEGGLSKQRARYVVAAALLVAEIDRLDREAERASKPVAPPSVE